MQDGWNYTGDTFAVDADGYFYYQARADDMIITAGYNIGGPEVEGALLLHPAVAECGVIGVPDEERGQIVKAFVVLKPGVEAGPAMTARAAGLRQADDRAVQVPARHRVPAVAAAHRDRQAAAGATATDGERAAGGARVRGDRMPVTRAPGRKAGIISLPAAPGAGGGCAACSAVPAFVARGAPTATRSPS